MHRQGATTGQARRHRGRSGASVVRFLWMLGYLSVGLGALFSTFFYPDLLSILRTQREAVSPYVFSQVFLRVPTTTCIHLAWGPGSILEEISMLYSLLVLPFL